MDDELRAWLGPAADEMTDEQMEKFGGIVQAVEALYPHPVREDDGTIPPDDLRDERQEAMASALQVLLGDAVPAEIGGDLSRARAGLADAMARARGAAIGGAAIGISELELEREIGLSRMTIRKILGK